MENDRRPNLLRRCRGLVARPADAGWLTAGADDWKRQTYAHSSPPSTGEHDSGGTNTCDCELILNTLMDFQSMQLGVKQMRQAAVKLCSC